MARRKASRAGYAKAAGAILIALALFGGISLVPQQTARAPHAFAARLGQAVGEGAAILPALFLIVGLALFVHGRVRPNPGLWGLLLGYAVGLVVVHASYPPGREFLAAAGRQGGGYVGAALVVILRRSVGEPGLWLAVGVGCIAALLLLSGISLTDTLRALLQAVRAAGIALAAAARYLGVRTAAAGLALLRVARSALAAGAGLCVRTGTLVLVGGARAATWTARIIGESLSEPGVPDRRAMPLRPRSAAEPVRAGTPGRGDVQVPLGRREGAAGEMIRAGLPGSGALTRSASAPPEAGTSARPLPNPEKRLEGSEDLGTDISPLYPEPAPASEDAVAGFTVTGERSRRQKSLVTQERLAFPGPPSRAYSLPDLSLLDQFPAGKSRSGTVDPDEVARGLERTLASFGVDARVVRWETGPVVTRYELQPAPGVKVQKITSLQNDIALALAASSVRLEAPIPGKSAIGVELPNERPGLVHLREILVSEEFRASTSPLTVAVGKAIAGAPVVADLVSMPHLLIAGATGAGKSVAINSMIASILFRSTPEHIRLLMIDPKRVELTNYNGIPHLLSPVVTGPREAAAKLRWAIQEMESRYETFAADGVRNIQVFNTQHPDRPLAYILIIIDELADLMMIAPADFEEIICRLAQMTRAVGIHLLIATQRPSVDVITGLIKANIPSRIAFSVTSQVDSRTILDHPGAEKLLGRGDMLFSPIGAVRPIRVQGAFISDAETERLVQFWRAQGEAAYVDDLVRAGVEAGEEGVGTDALLGDAARLIVRAGYASVSLLQRKMRIGYVRAARVVDQLEEKGIVGPPQGSNPREVLVGLDDLDRLLQRGAVRGSLSLPRNPDARGLVLQSREEDEPENG